IMKRFVCLCVVLGIGTLPLTINSMLPRRILAKVAAGPVPQEDGAERRRGDHRSEQEFYRQRAFQNGKRTAPDAYERALEQWRRMPKVIPGGASSRAASDGISVSALTAASSLTGTVWVPIGPSPVNEGSTQANGRVSSIAVNPNNVNLIYQGSSGGGLWRTIDGGGNWAPLYDQQSSLGTG